MKLAIGWTHCCKSFSHTPKGKNWHLKPMYSIFFYVNHMSWYVMIFNFHGRRIRPQQKEPRKANKTKFPDRYLHWRQFLKPLQFFKSRWSGTIWRTWSRREHQMFVLCNYASYAYLLTQVKKANTQGCSQNGMRHHCHKTAETHSSLFFVSGCKCCGRPLQRKRQPASKADEFKFVHTCSWGDC